ncbi:response regulator transcription factor [Metabacillus malikii]|nr:response regulator transcription factor [Metabacillus malikii]
MIKKRKILLIDDEEEIRELLNIYLSNYGYETFEARNGLEALSILDSHAIDLLLVDIMMPKMDGMELVKQVRKQSGILIIFMSAKSSDMDKISGLQMGADDYIAKPFNPLEVVSRVQALFRRVEKYSHVLEKHTPPEDIKIGELTLSSVSCSLYKSGKPLDCTSLEYKILYMLMSNPGRVFSKAQIYEEVWGEDYLGDENIIMVYISRIREKIENNPKKPMYLKTIRGLGYRFEKQK